MTNSLARRVPGVLALAMLASSFLALPAHADNCKYSAERTARIDGSVQKVVIKAGAGGLIVRGADRDSVEARGRACASSQDLLNAIQLETRRDGDTVYVKTVFPEDDASWFVFTRYAYLDLTLNVPKSAALSIEDGSGDLELYDARTAVVTDSSGDQTLRNIAGDLDVTDSSGDIRIEHVAGNLSLKDSSGDIDVRDVQGNVEVPVDSSGDMSFVKVAGNVQIVNDSSGDIEIDDVQRDVTIDVDSSGGIHAERVGGNFTVGADGSGGITYAQVVGRVSLPQN
jgi:Putative adhesin